MEALGRVGHTVVINQLAMPKIREHKRPAVQALVVSPWQSKQEHNTASAQPATSGPPCMYSVVTSDTLLAAGPAHEPAAAPPATQHYQHDMQGISGSANTPRLDAAAAAAHKSLSGSSTLASSMGWHQRQSKPQQLATAPSATHTLPAVGQPTMQVDVQDAHATYQRNSTQPQQPHHHQPMQSVEQQPATDQHKSSDTSADVTEEELAEPADTDTSDDWLLAGDSHTKQITTAAPTVSGVDGGGGSSTAELHGVAQLLLHPSGAISGHFVASIAQNSGRNICQPPVSLDRSSRSASHGGSSSSSSTVCLGLQGRQVLSIHSCYRDPEWALLQLSIIRYSSSNLTPATVPAAIAAAALEASSGTDMAAPQPPHSQAQQPVPAALAAASGVPAGGSESLAEADAEAEWDEAESVAWVQRKGGDLITLTPADLDDEDTEAAVLADNLGELPVNVEVNFTAHTLLAGAAADALLRKTWPELAGDADVVVNLGDMNVIGLPQGFLG